MFADEDATTMICDDEIAIPATGCDPNRDNTSGNGKDPDSDSGKHLDSGSGSGNTNTADKKSSATGATPARTGDPTNPILWLAFLAAACAALTVFLRRRRR